LSEQESGLLDKLKGLVRRVQEPWRGSAHPMELQRAILQQLEADVVGIRADKKVFPYTHLHLWLLAATSRERAVLEASFGDGRELAAAIREHLAALGCPVPDLTIELTLTGRRRKDFGDQRFAIQRTRRQGRSREEAVPDAPTEIPSVVRLTVAKGRAERKTYTLDQDRITIGRLREVTDEHGRLRRLNDIAFADDDEVGRSVSREHARIERREDGLRLIDERSAGGTRVFRAGRSIAISSRDRRGIQLQSGDMIYLGRAALRLVLPDEDSEGDAR
jgi:pSer/pThr/pTyr-binding forkhead associated (FHA) protein